MQKHAIFLLISALLAGCGSTVVSPHTAPLTQTVVNTFKIDTKVGDKINGTASATTLLGFIPLSSPSTLSDPAASGLIMTDIDRVMAGARYDAIVHSGADTLVAPQYTVDITDYWVVKTITANVTGYKGINGKPYDADLGPQHGTE